MEDGGDREEEELERRPERIRVEKSMKRRRNDERRRGGGVE